MKQSTEATVTHTLPAQNQERGTRLWITRLSVTAQVLLSANMGEAEKVSKLLYLFHPSGNVYQNMLHDRHWPGSNHDPLSLPKPAPQNQQQPGRKSWGQ